MKARTGSLSLLTTGLSLSSSVPCHLSRWFLVAHRIIGEGVSSSCTPTHRQGPQSLCLSWTFTINSFQGNQVTLIFPVGAGSQEMWKVTVNLRDLQCSKAEGGRARSLPSSVHLIIQVQKRKLRCEVRGKSIRSCTPGNRSVRLLLSSSGQEPTHSQLTPPTYRNLVFMSYHFLSRI